jgi:hypothetical protein
LQPIRPWVGKQGQQPEKAVFHLAAGTYFVLVSRDDADPSPDEVSYELSLSLTPKPLPGAVELAVEPRGDGLELSWPPGVDVVVERTELLGPQARWTPVPLRPAPGLDRETHRVDPVEHHQYFRVRLR